MEIQSLSEIIKNQQNSILSLSVHVDCLIEELVENNLINEKKLSKRMKAKLKKLQAIADKLRETDEITPMFNFGGPIGEA